MLAAKDGLDTLRYVDNRVTVSMARPWHDSAPISRLLTIVGMALRSDPPLPACSVARLTIRLPEPCSVR